MALWLYCQTLYTCFFNATNLVRFNLSLNALDYNANYLLVVLITKLLTPWDWPPGGGGSPLDWIPQFRKIIQLFQFPIAQLVTSRYKNIVKTIV